MARLYRQFLGSKPGGLVELVDDSSSPYLVKGPEGFEYSISADDFRNYYKPDGAATPRKWDHLITEPDSGLIDARLMEQAIDIIHSFEDSARDFFKAGSFVRDVLLIIGKDTKLDADQVRARLEESGKPSASVSEKDLKTLGNLSEDLRNVLSSDACASMQFIDLHTGFDDQQGPNAPRAGSGDPAQAGRKTSKGKASGKKADKKTRAGMKNVELSVEGDILTVVSDLSKEFGPSKSGKTIIVASTGGNKIVPGRDERIGLNIYKQDSKKPAKGRQSEFKNVKMSLDGAMLAIKVDLSKDFGDSTSGKTTIVASTEGNRLVLGREEKIGLNVYRKKE